MTTNANTLEMNFATEFRRLREAKKMSQAAVAAKAVDLGFAGWTQQTIQKIEKGRRPIRLDEADVLARVLDVPIADLMQPPMTIPELRAAIKGQKGLFEAAKQGLADAELERDEAQAALRVAERHVTMAQDLLNRAWWRVGGLEARLKQLQGKG
jgi:transcriptional regulator with XRE-family HTH domain